MATGTLFKNRSEAGEQLAERLLVEDFSMSLVLGLPRGGIPVALPVARKLSAPLDTVIARKIGLPGNPEYAIGAIAPGDVLVLDMQVIQMLAVPKEELDAITREEIEEMERRMVRYKSGSWSKDMRADTVIVVDDGLATGLTARAALESVKLNYKPKTLVFAAPVCARESLGELKAYTSNIICLFSPDDLTGISAYYEEFEQVTDESVLEDLAHANS